MGKKQQKKSRGAPQPVSTGSPADKAGRPSEGTGGDLGRQIRDAHAAGAWGKVITLWQQATKMKGNRHPPDPELTSLAADAYDQHGMSLYRKGNLSAAVTHLSAAAALSPEQSTYHYHLALARHRNGQWRDAVAEYCAALRVAPDDRRAAYHLSLACLQSGLECQPGGALDTALEHLQQQGTGDSLPWEVRRLQAWREYVRSGSSKELVALHTSERRPETALALEAAIVTLISGKAEGARRRLPDPADSAADSLSTCVEAVRSILSARAGHHRQAVVLAQRLAEPKSLPGGADWDLVRAVRIRALWEAGLAAWQNGDQTGAASLWQEALGLDPRNISLQLNTALALDTVSDPSAGQFWQGLARTWERSAGGKETRDASSQRLAAALAYRRAGEVQISLLNWREARRLLDRAITLMPRNAEILYDLAHLAVLTGDKASVQRDAPKLLELLRDDAARLTDLGHLLEESGLSEDGEPIWLRLLELDAEHECASDHLVNLHEQRGERAWNAGRMADALSHFERGLALAPGRHRLHIWLGGIYLLQGDRQRAAKAFGESHNGDDDPEQITYAEVEVGRHLLREGLRRDAEAAFRRGLEADASADTFLGIGLAYLDADQLDSAVKQFREAARHSSFDTQIMLTITDALNGKRAFAAAQELVLAALAAHPDDHNLWTMRSITEYGLKGPQADKSLIRKARLLALQEGDPGAVQALDEILSTI